MLKTRIKDIEQQKAKLEEEIVEIKFINRDKLKKTKDDMQKKLLQQEELHSNKLLEIAR